MLERSSLWRKLAAGIKAIFVILVVSLMYVPVVIIAYQAFNAGANAISPLSWGGFTWGNFAEIFTNRQLYVAILDSLLLSFWATCLATVCGLFASIGIHALHKKARRAMDLLNQVPMLNSEVVTGISIMLIFSLVRPLFPKVFGFATMLVAHVFFMLPYVILMVLPKLQQTDESLFEAATDLGCPPYRSLFKVIIPSLSASLLTGAFLAFTLSIDDFVISFYTQGNGFSNFSNYVYSSYSKKNFSPGSYAFNALLTFLTLGAVLLAGVKLGKGKGERPRRPR